MNYAEMGEAGLWVQAAALAKAAQGGELRLYDEAKVLLCTAKIEKASADGYDVECTLQKSKSVERGKPARFGIFNADGKLLWGGTAGVGEKFHMNCPIPELVKGLRIEFGKVVHSMRPVS